MAAFFREQVEAKNISVCWYCLPADGRCSASRLCDGFTPDVAGAGRSAALRLVELHRKRVANGERSVLVGYSHLPKGLI